MGEIFLKKKKVSLSKIKYCRSTYIYFCDGFKLSQISNTSIPLQIELFATYM